MSRALRRERGHESDLPPSSTSGPQVACRHVSEEQPHWDTFASGAQFVTTNRHTSATEKLLPSDNRIEQDDGPRKLDGPRDARGRSSSPRRAALVAEVDGSTPFEPWLMSGYLDQSLVELERAVSLSPSFAHGNYALAFFHCQSVDRSRGGLTSKLHVVVDANPLPVRAGITPGEAHNNRLCSALLTGLKPQSMVIADRGYDADWIRTLVNQQGARANIPPEAKSQMSHLLQPASVSCAQPGGTVLQQDQALP